MNGKKAILENDIVKKDGITGDDFKTAKVDSEIKKAKKETRGRKPKAVVEKQKLEEQQKAREFGAAILPKALESVEFMVLSRIPDETLRTDLKLQTEEKTGFSEAFLAVAEKHGWLNPSDMPELTLLVVTASIILPRIQIIKDYGNAKKLNQKPKTDKPAENRPKESQTVAN